MGVVEAEMARMEDYRLKVTSFFKEADCDGSGTLSWEEFEQHMQNRQVKAYFQALDLDITQAHKLFELLDVDNNNDVSLDEFLSGCARLRGGASNVDLNVILLHVQRLTSQVGQLRKRNEKQIDLLKKIYPAEVRRQLVTHRGDAEPGCVAVGVGGPMAQVVSPASRVLEEH